MRMDSIVTQKPQSTNPVARDTAFEGHRYFQAELDQGLVLLREHSDDAFCLNHAAALIWNAWQGGESVSDIAARLNEAFSVDLKTAKQDITDITTFWTTKGYDNAALIPFPTTLPPCAHLSRTELDPIASYHTRYQIHDRPFSIAAPADLQPMLNQLFGHLECNPKRPSALPVRQFHITQVKHGYHILTIGIHAVKKANTAEEAVLSIYYQVCELAQSARPAIALLHAAGVAKSGDAALLIAPGGSGKSTLAMASAYSGLTYLGDDALPLLPGGEIIPCPLPISVKAGSWNCAESYVDTSSLTVFPSGDRKLRFVSPPDRSMPEQNSQYMAQHVIRIQYQEGASTQLEAISPLQLFAEIINADSAMNRQALPNCFGLLIELLRKLPCYKLHYSDLNSAVAQIDTLLSS